MMIPRFRDPIEFSETLSWILAIAVLMAVFRGYLEIVDFIELGVLPVYTIAILLAFILHEAAHKYVAISRGCSARFTISTFGFLFTSVFGFIASILAFFGRALPFIVAAPGYVSIRCFLWGERTIFGGTPSEGVIALSGPAVNILLAIAGSIALALPLPGYDAVRFFSALKHVNSVLALFNLLPIPPLDGSKVIRWNPFIYILAIITALIIWII